MRRLGLILAALAMLALMASEADARRRHRHHHRSYRAFFERQVVLPAQDAPEMQKRGGAAQLVPSGWRLEPPSPDWNGRRYLSPEGDAWLALYATPASNDAAARFKAVAFGDGEDVTYLRGERDRLTVSGAKNDRVFYRKVMLACGGTVWRHVAVEYPAQDKRSFDRTIETMSRGFERIADEGCGDNVFTHPQPAQPATPAEPKLQPPT